MTKIGRHINVIHCLGVTIDSRANFVTIFEFCEFNSLKEFIFRGSNKPRLFGDHPTGTTKSYYENFPNYKAPWVILQMTPNPVIIESDLIFYAYQIASAMEFLSSFGVCMDGRLFSFAFIVVVFL